MSLSTSSFNSPEFAPATPLVALAIALGIALASLWVLPLVLEFEDGAESQEIAGIAPEALANTSFGVRPGPPDRASATIRLQVLRALDLENDIPLLFHGDSSTLMGIMPKVVEEEFNIPSENIGTIGWLGSTGHAQILRILFDKGKRPKVVVYGCIPETLWFDEDELEKRGYRLALRRWLQGRSPLLLQAPVLVEGDPSYALRSGITNRVSESMVIALGPQAIWPLSESLPIGRKLGSELDAGKGFLVENNPTPLGETRPLLPSTEGMRGLRDLAKLCARFGSKLVIVVNPRPKVETDSPAVDYKELDNVLMKFADEFAHVHYPLPVREYPRNRFQTANHLTQEGAVENSRQIALMLTEQSLIAPEHE